MMMRYLQTTIRQACCEVEPSITLLAGHWSSNLMNNFVLIFAGSPAITLVQKYEKAILCDFGPTFGLVPNVAYK
jgi:hypothetical protein